MRVATIPFLSFFIFIFVGFVSAEEAPKKDPTAWKKSASLGLNFTDGNSNTTTLAAGVSADQEKEKNIWHFSANFNYGEEDNSKTVERLLGDANYKRLLNERFYIGSGLNALRDVIADVEYRVLGYAGPGYFLVKEEDFDFYLEAGPGYLFEEVGGLCDDYFSPRVGEGFNWKISDTSRLFHTAFANFDLEEGDNYIINAVLGLEAKVTGNISLVTTLRDIYDNVPAAGLKKNDVQLITSLNYLF